MPFFPDHAIRVRPPYEIKVFGHPDKPYVLEWNYPRREGKYVVQARRHQLTTTMGAETFAIKHQIPRHRLPVALRRRLCDLAHTVKALSSTSSAL